MDLTNSSFDKDLELTSSFLFGLEGFFFFFLGLPSSLELTAASS
jgi:hypothetical protein